MRHRLCTCGLLAALALAAQKYNGPVPGKPDLPYIKQASDLIATEPATPRSEKAGSGTRFIVEGAASPTRTPLSLPVFLYRAARIPAENLRLYRMESKEGRREYIVGGPDPPDVLHMEVTKLDSAGLCRIAVSDPLEAGEYALAAGDTGQVFCFQVF